MKVKMVDTISWILLLHCSKNQFHAQRLVFGRFTISYKPFHKLYKHGLLFLFFEMVRGRDAAL